MAVVYNQKELINAIESGCKEITLCAGEFTVQDATSVVFKRIGPVKVCVDCTPVEAQNRGLKFIDIYPTFKAAYAVMTREALYPVSVGSSYGSHSSSGSFRLYSSSGSYSMRGSIGFSAGGSHTRYYEFEYEALRRTSVPMSYGAGASFSASHSGYGSDAGTGSGETDTVKIFGYGINLI